VEPSAAIKVIRAGRAELAEEVQNDEAQVDIL
jgi:hypothetical protein